MDLEKRVEEGEAEAPPKAQELLAAVQEFDRKCDPLDLGFGSGLTTAEADALKSGRKLSRLARRVAQAEIEGAKTEKGGWTKAQLATWGVPWPPPKGWKEDLAVRLADELKLREDVTKAVFALEFVGDRSDAIRTAHEILTRKEEAPDANA